MDDELKELSVKFKIDLSEFKNGIKEVQDNIRKVSNVKIPDVGKQVTDSVKQISSTSKKQAKYFNKSTNSIIKDTLRLNKSMKAMGRFGRFFAFSYLGRQIASMIKNMMIAGASMTETQNLFEVSFGEMSEQAEDFAKTLENAWGVSATLTKQQTAYLNNMLKSMGMTTKQAYGMSTGLVQLSHNMASLYDISQTDVYEKLRSAMVGVSRPLLQLGINTKVTELQQVALRNGIISTNRELTQQEKILATYWAIWEQTRSAWQSDTTIVNGQVVAIGDMTKTIGTNANMVRVLSNRLKDLGRIWGMAFQPIVTYVLPILYKLISALASVGKTIAVFVARLFGFKEVNVFEDLLKVPEFKGGGAPSDNGLVDYYDDVANSANKAKKATDKLTGSIDELNILSEPDTSGAGGFYPAMGGIENDIGLPKFDELIDEVITKSVDERLAEMKEKLLGLVEPLKEVGKGLLGAFSVGTSIATMYEVFTGFKNITPIISSITAALAGISTPLLIAVGAIGTFLGLFAILFATSEEFRNNIIAYANEIWELLVSIGGNVWNNFLQPIIKSVIDFTSYIWDNGLAYLIEQISYFINEIILLVLNLFNWFTTYVLPFVSSYIDIILKAIAPIIAFISNVIGVVIGVLTKAISWLNDVFFGSWTSVWKNIGNFFVDIWHGIVGAFESAINFIIDGVNGLISSFMFMNDVLSMIGLGKISAETFSHVSFGRVPRFADGGIAYGETMALVGEYANAKSNPEVIAPLDKLQAMIGNDYSSEETNSLMREVLEILKAILEKDNSIYLDGKVLARAIDKAKKRLGYAIMS